MQLVHSRPCHFFLPVGYSLVLVALGAVLGGTAKAGDRLAYAHFNPADPRPDFFEKPHYNAWVPYRKVYNRPTYVGGHIAAVVEPTSQEAMAWKIAKAKGEYKCHKPGYIPTYYYPKPWEALSIEARPDSIQSPPLQESATHMIESDSDIEPHQGVATDLTVDIN